VDHQIDETQLIPKRSAKNQFRQEIFNAWCFACAYCGNSADTLDHVKPRHKGGTTTTFNLIPACKRCNRGKGSTQWLEWYLLQEYHSDQRQEAISEWINHQHEALSEAD
jgi:hypothetical protein